MSQLIFDESTMLNGNIFKFEGRLQSSLNRYVENGAIFTTYFSQDENSSTVDRGIRDIDQLFGKGAPIRYNEIEGFPLYGFGQTNPENTDEQQIEDINVDGECVILPSTIVPNPNDFFIVNHLKMVHLFQVTNVSYDSMKPDGYYKIRYHLQTTSHETIQKLRTYQVIGKYKFDMNAIGTQLNPIIKEEDAITRSQITRMMNQMITSYRALFYNERHNCFLYHDPETGLDWFDMCGNEFMAKYSLMNYDNSGKVIVLHQKLQDPQMPIRYNNSIYNWLELGAPERMIRKFHFLLDAAAAYTYSSFVQWGDDEVQVIHPLGVNEDKLESREYSFFDETQFQALLDTENEPFNDYEKLIWKFVHKPDIGINDVSPYIADSLISSVKHRDIFLYTPIVIYIMRQILGFN